ncbi:MAG TPA: SDR family oxidoreductase [Usitatibacter sp.]|nr:SDR family oxidoreductase [Usitatibacter sp.]
MQTSAEGFRVLVTAGGAGIGRAIASTFHAHGARVHICDIDAAALAHCRGELPAISQSLADVSRSEDVERLFADVARELGGLDVLVNNAGIAGPTAKVEHIRPEDWDRCIAVDLNAMFYCTRLAMPMLKANGAERGGSIINLSSVAGRLGFGLRTPYAAAKWGVVGFTKSLAVEAGPEGIRVNCIQPGNVAGERINRVIESKAKARGVSFEEQKQELLATTSLRTFVLAEDIANMALFLATQAGRHISGQAISVCGDLQKMI